MLPPWQEPARVRVGVASGYVTPRHELVRVVRWRPAAGRQWALPTPGRVLGSGGFWGEAFCSALTVGRYSRGTSSCQGAGVGVKTLERVARIAMRRPNRATRQA